MKTFAAFFALTFAHSASALSYLNSLNGATVSGGLTTDSTAVSPAFVRNSAGPSEEMLALISKQVSVELMASQQYMAASIWFRTRNMDGMALWMLDESDEERGHGKEILEFAMKNHYQVVLEPLSAPQNEWQSPADVWQTILALEENNTQNLLRIAGAADACGMYGVKAFLDPFHMEQIEAEDKVGGIVARVQGASSSFLWELDHELGMEAEAEEQH